MEHCHENIVQTLVDELLNFVSCTCTHACRCACGAVVVVDCVGMDAHGKSQCEGARTRKVTLANRECEGARTPDAMPDMRSYCCRSSFVFADVVIVVDCVGRVTHGKTDHQNERERGGYFAPRSAKRCKTGTTTIRLWNRQNRPMIPDR